MTRTQPPTAVFSFDRGLCGDARGFELCADVDRGLACERSSSDQDFSCRTASSSKTSSVATFYGPCEASSAPGGVVKFSCAVGRWPLQAAEPRFF